MHLEAVLAGMFDSGSGRSETLGRHQDIAKWAAKDRRAHLSRGSSSTLTRDVRSSSSGGQIVAMMQAADSGHRYDPTTAALILLYLTNSRRSLRERKMSPVLVEVTGILVYQAFQVPFVENDHVVEQVAVPGDGPYGDGEIITKYCGDFCG